MANKEEMQKSFSKIIAKAWTDDEFKVKLMSDPKAALKENGVDVPDGINLKIVEDTPTLTHLTLPERSRAKGGELSDEDLDRVAGGGEYYAGGEFWFGEWNGW